MKETVDLKNIYLTILWHITFYTQPQLVSYRDWIQRVTTTDPIHVKACFDFPMGVEYYA